MHQPSKHSPATGQVEEFSPYPSTMTREQMRAAIVIERNDLYNRCQPCGPRALRNRLSAGGVRNVPSPSTITRILAAEGLVRFGHNAAMED
jgi:hypothetical protein